MASAPVDFVRVLTCGPCQARKVKCDRLIPCSRCIRANIPCKPHTPPKPEGRRRPRNDDLRARLARCEELLTRCVGSDAVGVVSPDVSSLSPASQPGSMKVSAATSQPGLKDGSASLPTACAQVQNERGTYVVDGCIWASIHEEVKKMQNIVEANTSDLTTTSPATLLPDCEVQLLLQGDNAFVDLATLMPLPAHTFRLWQIFLDRVNPLTKVVHAPSLFPYILDATADIRKVPLHYQAVLFAIYTLAILSLSDDESIELFSESRQALLQRYTMGARTTLARLNFLKHYDMVMLQALVLFLCSLGGRCDPHTAWLLCGIVVRIAQKMGYHRDGEAFSLNPFETEMRRRIWWCIVVHDANYAMVSGLASSLLPARWDTKEPQNLNDADMFVNSSKPLKPRKGPTEMVFCIIMYRIYKLRIDLEAKDPTTEINLGAELMAQCSSAIEHPEQTQPAISLLQHSVHNLDCELRALENAYLNIQAGNVHVAAASLRPTLVAKLRNMCPPTKQELARCPDSSNPEVALLKILVVSHEHVCDLYQHLSVGRFEWSLRLLIQWDQLAALTGLLTRMPTGELSDRGWEALCKIYVLLPDLSNVNEEGVVLQARNTLIAWQAREAATADAGCPATRPACILRLQGVLDGLHKNTDTLSGTHKGLDAVTFLAPYNTVDTFWNQSSNNMMAEWE